MLSTRVLHNNNYGILLTTYSAIYIDIGKVASLSMKSQLASILYLDSVNGDPQTVTFERSSLSLYVALHRICKGNHVRTFRNNRDRRITTGFNTRQNCLSDIVNLFNTG